MLVVKRLDVSLNIFNGMNMELQKFKVSNAVWQKRVFNPQSKQDLMDYKFFLENSRWGKNCPFELEWPHLTITDMIKDKLIEQYLDTMLDKAIVD
jgi:hypothetical protein